MEEISAIFNIGKGAIQANSAAMEVVSHNIANVNTPGYSRQIAVLAAEAPSDPGVIKLGLGVRVTSVVQAFDRYTTKTIQQNTSKYLFSLRLRRQNLGPFLSGAAVQ